MSHGIYALEPDVNNLSQLSVVVMASTPTRVGGVMPGLNITIDPDGMLNVPPTSAFQTPWLSTINGAGNALTNVGSMGVGVAAPAYAVDVLGDVNVTGAFRVNGVPIHIVAQTPWLSNIDAAGYQLTNIPIIYGPDPNDNYLSLGVTNDAQLCSLGGSILLRSGWSENQRLVIDNAGHVFINVPDDTTKAAFSTLGTVGIGTYTPQYQLDIQGDCNITGTYRVNGVPISSGGGGSQTPWLSDINAAGYRLLNAGNVFIGNDGSVIDSGIGGPHLIVGSTTTNVPSSMGVSCNAAANGGNIGGLVAANYARTTADKRIAEIWFATGSTIDSGVISFWTYNAGAMNANAAMVINQTGNVTMNTPVAGSSPTLSVAGGAGGTGGSLYDAIWFGTGSVAYPAVAPAGQALVGRGGTSDFRIHIQDGGGRVNMYWNACGAGGGYYVVGNEPALRFTMTPNGTSPNGGGSFSFLDSSGSANPGDAVSWRTVFNIAGGATSPQAFISPRGNAADFFISGVNGEVGIGTTTPSAPLHVSTTVQPTAIFQNDPSHSNCIAFWDGATPPNRWWIGQGLNTTTDGTFFVFDPSLNVARLSINRTGASSFQAFGSPYGTPPAGSWAMTVQNDTNGANYNGLLVTNQWQASNSTLLEVGSINAAGGNYITRFHIDGIGNVGIGTAAPAAPLDVSSVRIAPAGRNTFGPPNTFLQVTPLVTPTSAATALQIITGEQSAVSGYGLSLGYECDSADANRWKGVIQSLAGGTGWPLLLNALGGAVGISTTTPNVRLSLGNNVYTAPLGSSYAQYQISLYDGGSAAQTYGMGVESYNIGFNSAGGYKFYQSGAGPFVSLGGQSNTCCAFGAGGSAAPTSPTAGIELAFPDQGATVISKTCHIALREASLNNAYYFRMGYQTAGGTWSSVLQSVAGNGGAPLLLNPGGGVVGVGTTAPNTGYALDVAGDARAQVFIVSPNSNGMIIMSDRSSGNSCTLYSTGDVFRFYWGGDKVWIDSAGNITATSRVNGYSGLMVNLGYNGSNWIYGVSATGLIIQPSGGTIGMWVAPSGSAGAAASVYEHMVFNAGAYTQLMYRTWLWTPQTPDGYNSSNLPQGYISFEANGTTSVTMRYRGSDGVIRSVSWGLS